MFRAVSLLGIAVFALAAVALVRPPRAVAGEPGQDDNTAQAEKNRLGLQLEGLAHSYHAKFSLN
jgi:hypothetical protein